MALFGKKTDEAGDTQATPASGTQGKAPADSTFDFDAISRDLDAQNGPSSFDALLSQPVSPSTSSSAAPPTSTSDALSNDPLGLSTPQTPLVNSAVTPVSSPDSVLNAPLPSTTTPPTAGVAPTAGVTASVVTPVAPPHIKKSFPLIPVLGVLGLVAVAIGGRMFMVNTSTPTPDVAPEPPAGSSRPETVTNNTASMPNNAASNTGAPMGAGRSPGIAPASVAPSRGPNVIIQVPAAKGPSATGGLDHALADRLKAYWEQGADAKHRKDYAAARQAWGAALQLRPGHPGFQEAINKLPR